MRKFRTNLEKIKEMKESRILRTSEECETGRRRTALPCEAPLEEYSGDLPTFLNDFFLYE